MKGSTWGITCNLFFTCLVFYVGQLVVRSFFGFFEVKLCPFLTSAKISTNQGKMTCIALKVIKIEAMMIESSFERYNMGVNLRVV